MNITFEPGDRVIPTEDLRNCAAPLDQWPTIGVVVERSGRYPSTYKVKWDDRDRVMELHKSYIRRVAG